MATVEFLFEGTSSIIQCKPEDKMLEIISRFVSKSNLDLDSLYFIFDGKILNKELTFDETTKADSIRVLVYETNEKEPKFINVSKIKPKFIKCSTCNENTILHFDNNKINLSNCRNGHTLKKYFIK